MDLRQPQTRRQQSTQVRDDATRLAATRPSVHHVSNGEEQIYRAEGSFMSFTKGLEHDPNSGLACNRRQLEAYRAAIDSGSVASFDAIQIGSIDDAGKLSWHFHTDLSNEPDAFPFRRWESPTAGLVFDLQGPDAQAVTMPPAPRLNVGCAKVEAGAELVAEMAEVYLLALLRDTPLQCFDNDAESVPANVEQAIEILKQLAFYQSGGNALRIRPKANALDRSNVFRGQTPGECIGPYLSQFLLLGNTHLRGTDQPPIQSSTDGRMQYGAISIDMRVRIADTGKDYMTHWNDWLDVQHGADVGARQSYSGSTYDDAVRFISTPRDMATYVHVDALYEAYLNACLWLLNVGAPLDPRFRSTLAATPSTVGFALQGGPHILTLVTEVATRALKAVRYQKFNNHLRARPEALAARLAACDHGTLPESVYRSIAPMYEQLSAIGLMDWVKVHNQRQNQQHHQRYLDQQHEKDASAIAARKNLPLLPMAFSEGSPMHPSYGAGHATVAGACVTMLKAFFDEDAVLLIDPESGAHFAASPLQHSQAQPLSYVPSADGSTLQPGSSQTYLSVGHELNKLAGNISIARNMGGVHFYTDYIESMRMGEAIAIGILEEQALTYRSTDRFSVQFTTFDGQLCSIDENGHQLRDAVALA